MSDTPSPATADALTLPASTVPDPRTAPALRWGVVSPGGIARTFTRALHGGTASRVVAVCSRSLDRAEAFAAEHADAEHPITAYEDLGAMLAAGGLDAVYIASPHAQHHALTRPVLEAQVPVLVEKAFTLDAAQAQDLLDLAAQRGVLCAEAMWTRFLPQMDVLRRTIDAGLIGDVVALSADHGQAFPLDPAHRLYAPELGGGALLDLGVYPISFAQAVLGDLSDLAVQGSLTDTGVDAELAVIASGARGGRAVLHSTLSSRTPTQAWIGGTEGSITLDGAFYRPTTLTVRRLDGASASFTHPGDPELAMAYEAAEVARCVADGLREAPSMPWAATLSVMRTMDAIRAELGVVYPGEGLGVGEGAR